MTLKEEIVFQHFFSLYGAETSGVGLIILTFFWLSHFLFLKKELFILSFIFYTLLFKNTLLFILLALEFILSSSLLPSIWEEIQTGTTAIVVSIMITQTLYFLHFIKKKSVYAVMGTFFLIIFGIIFKQSFFFPVSNIFLPFLYLSLGFILIGILLFARPSSSMKGTNKIIAMSFEVLGVGYLLLFLPFSFSTILTQTIIYSFFLYFFFTAYITTLNRTLQTADYRFYKEKAQQQALSDISPFPILISRLEDDQILYMNKAAQALFNLPSTSCETFLHMDCLAGHKKYHPSVHSLEKQKNVVSLNVLIKNPQDKHTAWYEINSLPIYYGSQAALYSIFKDMTAFKQKEKDLIEKANTDPLSGLYNRYRFETLAAKSIRLAFKRKKPFCLLMIDVDYFKNINDTYGHDAGDAVLKKIAVLLKKILPKASIIARFGGEEFIVFLPHVTMEEAQIIADHFRKTVEQTKIICHNHFIRTTVSIGISKGNTPQLDVLIRQADTALYYSKKKGRNRISFYTDKKEAFI